MPELAPPAGPVIYRLPALCWELCGSRADFAAERNRISSFVDLPSVMKCRLCRISSSSFFRTYRKQNVAVTHPLSRLAETKVAYSYTTLQAPLEGVAGRRIGAGTPPHWYYRHRWRHNCSYTAEVLTMQWIYVLVALILVVLIGWFMNRNNIAVPMNGRTLLNIVLALVVVGIGLWLINTYVPMAGSIKAILNIVVVVATCVGVLQAFGLWGHVLRLWDNLAKGVRRSTLTSPAPTPDTPHSTKT